MGERNPLLAVFVFGFLFSFSLFSPTFTDDADIMKKVASSFSSTPSDWLGFNPCIWSGIVCDSSNQVISIDVSSKSISGILAPEINQLSQLESLSLQRNQISGTLPSFSNLTHLQTLILDDNNFTSIPSSIFLGLINLETLSLSDNVNLDPWFLPLDLTQSRSLSSLYISNANLKGSIPDFFHSFPSMQSLRLSYNNLTGPLPSSLARSGIQNLWLNHQVLGLSGPIDVIGKMRQLSQVWLHRNMFSGPIPDLSNCVSLFDLQFRHNQLTGVLPTSIFSLPRLVNISLDSNKLQGPYPVFRFEVVVKLGTTNSFCDTKPGPCGPQVTTLLAIAGALGYPITLADSWQGNDACQQWTFINCDSEGKYVTGINFGKQHFSGTISPLISNLTSLMSLYLNDNNLTGPIPDSLTSLTHLQNLDVSNNNLTGKLPEFRTNVAVKTSGNLLLGINSTSEGDTGAGRSQSGEGNYLGNKDKKNVKVIIIITVVIGIVVVVGVGVCTYLYCKRRGTKQRSNRASAEFVDSNMLGDNQDLQIFNFEMISIATSNFDDGNKLGQGGFGPVFKGILPNGQEIAVKRLSKSSGQGVEEFKNEIVVISKLQHRNLVRLLGCCIEGDEKMLIYEFLPNKSLDSFIFDPTKRALLDWKKRLKIIEGIGRGILYLHRDSRLRVIHRDLKASNILLDENLNPKISDFGMARIFGGNELQANTRRVVGTYGYMSPEYAMDGLFSEKSDVFSFGVLLLEIVSGKRNASFQNHESWSLLGYAWKLWNEGEVVALIDSTLSEPSFTEEILKCIHVGLLCVQDFAKDRPSVSTIISMLTSEITNLPTPKQPAFTERQIVSGSYSSLDSNKACSINNVTITCCEGR